MSQPPPGQTTNFVNPVSISWAGRLSIWLTLPIMVVAFVLRAYVRLKAKQMEIDDCRLRIQSVDLLRLVHYTDWNSFRSAGPRSCNYTPNTTCR